MVKELYENYLPDLLGRFERRAATNNAPEGWIWGSKVVGQDMLYIIKQFRYSQDLELGERI